MLVFKDLIECPNLESFTGRWPRDQLWEIPPWVSPSLSELTLEAEFGGNIPELPTSIRPSVVTIELEGDNPYLDLFTWIIDCVDHFPVPGLIQDLTITIVNSHRLAEHPNVEQLYPRISEYVVLARFLEYLCEDGGLESVNLDITMTVDSLDVDLHASAARELAKLKMGFEGLLKADVLHVSFEVERWVDCESETVLYCDI
ncbi:hypothetical protein EYR38_004998 [Pleurotus pulmonarius]|nr:hypothetical protein EYR38_004998 [Pleurotus pulmonarius]